MARKKKSGAPQRLDDTAAATATRPEAAEPAQGPPCPIVGFGASAGGLEAITEILRYLGNEPGMAIVFIQHLDPKHSSMLTELLARATSMPVDQVTDGMRIEANHVYVIPPNTCIGVRRGYLLVEPRQPSTPHMPIDRVVTFERENRQAAVNSNDAHVGTERFS
jgi:two-component system CheB/CheR fusion protein